MPKLPRLTGRQTTPPPKTNSPGPVDPGREFSRREKILPIAVLAVIYALAGTWGQFDFGDMMGYYNMAADATLKGQLYLDYTPDKVNLIDMIPYQGRYYLQWGPWPIVFHLAAKVVGLRLSDRVVCLLAGLLTAWLFFEIMLELRRRYFPEQPKALCRWFLFAFALATPAALVSWRPTVYNEVIALGALGVVAAFWAFLRYQRQPGLLWLLLAGAGIATALLTRISLVLYAVPFFLAIGAANWLWKRSARTVLMQLAVFSLPVVCAGVVQMAYNQARFGSPLDFGIRYKPETTDENFQAFSLLYLPENLGHYVLSLPKVSADFPWLDHIGWEPRVHTSFAEGMSSILLASPFLVLVLLVGRILAPRSGYPPELRLAAALAAGSGLVMFAVMLCFVSASRRYVQDFMPLLMIVAFLGAATLDERTVRRWMVPGWVVIGFSALLHAHVAFYESFRSPQPDLNVTRTFIALAPSIRQVAPGPVLDKEEAMARNDWGTVLLNRRRFAAALEQFERANKLLPDSPVIERNLRMAQQAVRR